MKRGTCPKCASNEVLPALGIRQQSTRGMPNENVGIVLSAPGSPSVTSVHHTKAWVCARCGYLETYVEDPQRLASLYANGHR
jgi:ribosomal protein S27AE